MGTHHVNLSSISELTSLRTPAEYMRMEDTFSPVLHRIDQAIRWRAVHPTEPIPPPYEILTKFSKPPEELQSKAKRHLEKLMAAADVKKGQLSPRILPTCDIQLTQHSPTETQRPKARPQHSKTPLRPQRRRSPRPRKTRQNLPRQLHPRIQANARHDRRPQRDPRRRETNGRHHRGADLAQPRR